LELGSDEKYCRGWLFPSLLTCYRLLYGFVLLRCHITVKRNTQGGFIVSVPNAGAEAVPEQHPQKREESNSAQIGLTQPPFITSSAAKKKVNLYLGLHWGQNFSVDDPVLQGEGRARWVVPVWYSTPHEGRTTKMLDVSIDAQTGELMEEATLRQALEQFGG